MALLVIVLLIAVGILAHKLSLAGKKLVDFDASKARVDSLSTNLTNLQSKLDSTNNWAKSFQENIDKLNVLYGESQTNLKSVQAEKKLLTEELKKVADKLQITVHQKKSSEVKTGLIAEQLAPFVAQFKYDPKKAHFLAQPIDYIIFDETGIHFVEVKSGNAQLTSIQRRIRDDVEQKRVTFEIVRINGGE